VRVPQATVIHIDHVPPRVRARLIAALTRRDGLPPTLATPAWPVAPTVAAIAAAAAAAIALRRTLVAPPQPAIAALAIVLSGLAAFALARAAWRWREVAALPFSPGLYVVGAFLLDARGPLLELVAIARVRPEVRRRRRGYVLRCVLGPGAIRLLPIGDAAAVHRALTLIHGDLIAYATALAVGDAATAARLDPFALARDRDGVVIGAPSGPVVLRPRRRARARLARVALAAVATAALGALPLYLWT
jgi:hypothetical protein